MTEPKVSLVFTSYNHKEYLHQALDSLLGQTFADFELIVIDDRSTDGSQAVLEAYAARDERIRLFLNQTNSGSYVHSTNQGASYARAPYVVFAQCDDYAEPTQLEKLYRAITTNPNVGVVYSSSRMVDEQGNSLGDDYQVREAAFREQCASDTRIDKQQITRYFLRSCVIPNLSAAMIRRELFEKQGGLSSDYLVLADWDFWLKTTLECDFYYLREPLNNFRQHQTTIRASVKTKRQVEEVFRMYYNFFQLSGMGFGGSLPWRYNACSVWAGYFGQGKKAWFSALFPLLGRAFRYDPLLPVLAICNFTAFGAKVICLAIYKRVAHHLFRKK